MLRYSTTVTMLIRMSHHLMILLTMLIPLFVLFCHPPASSGSWIGDEVLKFSQRLPAEGAVLFELGIGLLSIHSQLPAKPDSFFPACCLSPASSLPAHLISSHRVPCAVIAFTVTPHHHHCAHVHATIGGWDQSHGTIGLCEEAEERERGKSFLFSS